VTTEGAPTSPAGEVFDLGYRRYEGAREGRWRSRKAIWRDGVRTTLGLGRGLGQKVLPWGFIALTWLPALVIVVISGFIANLGEGFDNFEGPSYGDYYEGSMVFVLLFAATVAPELLCPDRRSGVITLYLVRPLSTLDYLGSRWFAFLTVMLAMVWFPQLVIFAWRMLSASSPLDELVDEWTILPRLLLSGFVLAVFATTLALAASTFTTRRAWAAAVMLGVIFVSTAIGGIGTDVATGDAGKWFSLLIIPDVLIVVTDWILGERLEPTEALLPPEAYVIWVAVLTALYGIWLWWRYRRLAL